MRMEIVLKNQTKTKPRDNENSVRKYNNMLWKLFLGECRPSQWREGGAESRRAQAALQVTLDRDLEAVSQRGAVAQKGCKTQAATVAFLF